MHNFNSSHDYKNEKHLINICDQEPIHIPGSIQSSGFAIVFGQNGKIKYCSENAEQWISRTYDSMIGLSPEEIFISKQVILEIFDSNLKNSYFYRESIVGVTGHFDITVVATTEAGLRIVEIEKSNESILDSEVLELGITSLAECKSVDDLYDQAVKWVKRTIGFDRVKLYLFDEDWNGTVVAEDKEDFMPSYKNLRFPATDIPKQARALYVLNKVRVLSDVNSEPVNLLPKAPLAQAIDLSYCGLRSISPIHIEYLRNMKVGASFSASVVIEGRLVGLIACHHSKPKHIPLRARRQAEVFGRTLSLEMQRIKFSLSKGLKESATKVVTELIKTLKTSNLEDTLRHEMPRIQKLLKADGVGVKFGDSYFFHGLALDTSEIQQVEYRLEQKEKKRIYSTKQISLRVPDLIASGVFGFLRIPIELRSPITLFAFRKEFHSSISWGGADLENAKTIYADEEGRMRVSPRKSFETFKVNTKSQSEPWLQGLLYEELASGLRGLLLNESNFSLTQENKIDEGAQLKIDELKNKVKQLRFEVAESRSTEYKLQLALDVSAVGSWEYDPQDDRIKMDYSASQMLNANGNERILQQFVALFPLSMREDVSNGILELDRPNSKFTREIIFEDSDTSKVLLLKAESYSLAEVRSSKVVGVVMDVSSLRTMESDIRDIQEELEQFFNADLVGTFISNDNGDILKCNRYFLQLLGFPKNQLELGSVNWKMLTPVDQYSIDLENIKETKLGNKANYSKQMFDADGKRIEVLFSISYNEESDRFYGLVKSNMDEIVERNKAETIIQEQRVMLLDRHKSMQAFNKQLLEANQRLENEIALRKHTEKDRALLEKAVINAQEMIIITDAEFIKQGGQPRITYVNEALIKMTGYSEEEIIGNSPKMFQNANTTDESRDKIKKALFAKKPVKTRITNCSKTGREYIVELSISPVFGPDGELVNFVGVQQDVTDKEEQLKEIESARQRFESIASNLPKSLVFLVDKSGTIKYTGGQNKDKITRNEKWVFDILEADQVALDGFSKWTTSQANPTFDFKAKNSGLTYDVQCSLVHEDSFIVLAQDISKRVELAIKERELDHARSIAKMKTDFINHASHQLKTPISSIELNISVLRHFFKDDVLEPGIQAVLARLEKESRRLMELTKNTLEVSRVTDQSYVVKRIKINLIDYVQDIVDLFLNTKEYSNRIIKIKTQLKKADVMLDEFLLGQIVQNIVSNALKYSEKEVLIHIKKGNKSGYQISIEDKGIGIPESDLGNIFNEFYRSDNSARAHGTGLGLYLVKKSVELINGRISVESIVGKGTTFKLILS